MATILSADELVPLRALNQITYCPRLYYLEYVESLMQVNEHVADGTFQHRRVNDPELEGRTRQEKHALHTRSVSLDSPSLGVTGKLDLLEEKNGECYPVEYKRGSGPADGGFWDNDAVQVCGQALLVEESLGRTIGKGVLYYQGSKRRVDVPLDDALRSQTLAAIRLARELSQCDTPPPPLPAELQHRCHGCSLATVCQPEETLFLLRRSDELAVPPADGAGKCFKGLAGQSPTGETTGPAAGGATNGPRVLPARDEGAVVYLQENGSSVGKRGEHLVVRKDGAELQRIPLASVRQVVVFGNVQVSTQALECLVSNEIPVVYLTAYGRFIAALEPAPRKNVMLRADQYRAFADPARSFALAKAVVRAKIANQRTLLMRSLRARNAGPDRGDDEEAAEEAAGPGYRASQEPAVRDMGDLLQRLDAVHDPAVLLGTEGQAAQLYFSQFGRLLKAAAPGRAFDFRSRNRRPPRDPVNALLSFAYALLAKDCFSALLTVGFDPYLGFFHAGRHGRASLALDLMEEFRAVIADSVVLTLVNNEMLAPRDFLIYGEACQLTESGRTQFFRAYEQRKATVVKHPVFGYSMSYSRMLEVQARMLASHVRGELAQYQGFTVR